MSVVPFQHAWNGFPLMTAGNSGGTTAAVDVHPFYFLWFLESVSKIQIWDAGFSSS